MRERLKALARIELAVPYVFLMVSIVAVDWADMARDQVVSASTDILDRIFRNMFLVLSLIIPIVAGLGLNFGIVLGAMAGQVGLLVAQNGEVPGIGGILVAVICAIPVATLLGYLTGLLFNRTPGREMITGFILGFFSNGIYQFLFLILAGPVIPLNHPDILLPQKMGLRVTVNLTAVERGLDAPLEHADPDSILRRASAAVFGEDFRGTIPLEIERYDQGLDMHITEFWGEIPVLTMLIILALCLAMSWFLKTKLGQNLRAVGQDSHVAEVAGIRVSRCRIIAVVISIILASIGQVIFLQNMAVMNTFTSHEQTGFYAIAAILVGGASVSRAKIWNAVAGTVLFHTMIVVVSAAGQTIMESPQIGEFLREFAAYAIIGTTLAIYSWKGGTGPRSRIVGGLILLVIAVAFGAAVLARLGNGELLLGVIYLVNTVLLFSVGGWLVRAGQLRLLENRV